ncbi:hypothetical protein NEHOM01_0153 [Nematocida homosporus]|uniref:uncharacterized protein n=1 Tax=Nematocida homosporus TaxID=1912981 RepID=UPI00221FC9EB|nr:uncharacterized protein NEHOM01_0153 [Nematocida homosporus]KAI5184408.1 hypothetical protein NEHOM01_0153 [Nematocida homosporus]
MFNQKTRAIVKLHMLLCMCLLILSCQGASAASQPNTAVIIPPTLMDLANNNFIWAQNRLEQINKANDGDEMTLNDADAFIESGFYAELGFEQDDLDRVKRIASLLKGLFIQTNMTKIDASYNINDVPELIVLYHALNRNLKGENPKTPTTIDSKHKRFVENLAMFVYSAIYLKDNTPDGFDLFEKRCLGSSEYANITGAPLDNDKQPLFSGDYRTFIRTKEQISSLENSPLLKYAHPINTGIYLKGLKYTYCRAPGKG